MIFNLLGVAVPPENPRITVHATTYKNDADLWHCRPGHISSARIQQLQSHHMATGLTDHSFSNLSPCTACLFGKQTRQPFPTTPATRTSALLELIHTDICGPISPPTHTGFQYFILFIDDFSRYCYAFLLMRKSDAFQRFSQFVTLVENQHFPHKIKILRSDNGGEYKSSVFNEFCLSKGIKCQYTVPYTPQQNGVSERRNRTLINSVLSMLYHSGLPKTYWGEALLTANYLHNRTPSKALDPSKIPYELWHSRKPDLCLLKVFGSPAFAKITAHPRAKLDFRTTECMFLGYSEESKGY